jgi:putative ABC transport system permease protein
VGYHLRSTELKRCNLRCGDHESPGEPIGFTYHNLTKRALTDPDDNVPYKVLFVDDNFIPVYNIPLKAGRNYDMERGEDTNGKSIILNESAVKALGFKSAEEAVDKEIKFMVTFDWETYRIIGVTEDYRHESVKIPQYPTIFFLNRYVGQMTYYSVAIDRKADMRSALSYAENVWKEVLPAKPFDFAFADQRYDRQLMVLSVVLLISVVNTLLAARTNPVDHLKGE